jgi:hypothetical protein
MAATVTIIKPNTALAKLTTDSIASDSKPTESVSHQANVLRVMVIHAATTETLKSAFGVSHLDWAILFIC